MKNANIGMRGFRQLVELVLEQEKPGIAEVLPDSLLQSFSFPTRSDAFVHLHFPDTAATLLNARNRMKFEELFFFELMLALRQQGVKNTDKAPEINPPSPSARALMNRLPFELTNAQKRVIHEIVADMRTSKQMNRLLQGDVGSGKTIVALLTMLMAVDNGYQALLLAPTEILAEQHYQGMSAMLKDSGIQIAQIVGGQNKRVRNNLIDEIVSGKVNIIIGTHALFGGSSQKEAEKQWLQYHKVGLVVIDEQHRFGVMQRAKLRELSMLSHGSDPKVPHTLVMSATPIPRTLSMTLYGDLDVSIINELPKNRKPIHTKVVFESSLDEHYEFIRSEVRKGRQAYIVYPLVEESEKLELKAATLAFEELLHEVFPDLKVGMLHGQMLWYEKEDAMKQFLNREFDILVATTVVEVGIDVPNATVMLIQNAERFGLAQLHQLRGRVGRGAEQSYCLLATKDHFVYNLRKKEAEQSEKLSAIVRLRTMEQTGDGFKIAEVDLKLRGPGDVMGTRQSGLPDFQFSDLVNDEDMIEKAKRE
ncbi:MAG: ATP-dependent DNA helicase RecG, partial [Candidatus Kapabacteria bacterium]|nr:ATP-dependent DNA helicase RecG [Candidatus Kapabacteria bacterium]